jgi:hypothetical protein
MVSRLLLVWALLAGCGSDPSPSAASKAMPASDLLIRASLDLRGVRPSQSELERVEADPAAVDSVIEDYLSDPRFGERVAALFAEITLTRTESYPIDFTAFALDESISTPDLLRSIGEEPVRIIGRVAAEDLPITQIVTGDWTMANDALAAMYPLDTSPDGSGWRVAHYTDGRPPAGILATNGLWWRYMSTESNANRKRANQISRILLCHDYLVRPIDFDRNVDLLDEEALADAMRNDPGCQNCHVSLDPLASYLYGFWWYTNGGTEIARYHPSRELRWSDYTGVPPSFYGDPGSSLADLGRQIAADNRFPECMVEHTWELLLRRDTELADFDELSRHRNALIEGDLTFRALFRSVLSSPDYRAAPLQDAAATAVPLKMVTPDLLASQIEDLTGFRFMTSDGWDLMQSDTMGFLTLAGGADGQYATRAADGPNSTLLLVQERLAEAAAENAVRNGGGGLLKGLDLDATPTTNKGHLVSQLQHLHFRIFGNRVAADGAEVEANLGLFADVLEVTGDTTTAWEAVLTALLRDPDILFY